MAKKRVSKADLIQKISDRIEKYPSLDCKSRKAVSEMIDLVFTSLGEVLVESGTINVPRFGTFVITTSKPRVARNPRTGETVKVGARKRVKFRPSAALTEKVR